MTSGVSSQRVRESRTPAVGIPAAVDLQNLQESSTSLAVSVAIFTCFVGLDQGQQGHLHQHGLPSSRKRSRRTHSIMRLAQQYCLSEHSARRNRMLSRRQKSMLTNPHNHLRVICCVICANARQESSLSFADCSWCLPCRYFCHFLAAQAESCLCAHDKA